MPANLPAEIHGRKYEIVLSTLVKSGWYYVCTANRASPVCLRKSDGGWDHPSADLTEDNLWPSQQVAEDFICSLGVTSANSSDYKSNTAKDLRNYITKCSEMLPGEGLLVVKIEAVLKRAKKAEGELVAANERLAAQAGKVVNHKAAMEAWRNASRQLYKYAKADIDGIPKPVWHGIVLAIAQADDAEAALNILGPPRD
jgi:hypothetical protein